MTTPRAFDSATYTTAGSTRLGIDIFAPAAENRRCAVLVLHGGAWRVGAKEAVHDRASALAAAGFTALAVQYRLLDAAPWPAPLADVSAALAWTRANAADLGVEAEWTVVQGHSAGAHIALMTGTLGPAARPAAIVAYYPPIGFHPVAPPPLPDPTPGTPTIPPIELDAVGRLPSWMLFGSGGTRADLDAASPIALVDRDFPATIVVHGTADKVIHPRSSIALHQRLVELGVDTDLHLYAGRDHEFDRAPSMSAATVAATTSFLHRVVTHRADNDAEVRAYPFPPR